MTLKRNVSSDGGISSGAILTQALEKLSGKRIAILVVEEEFFGVDERPDDVFVGHAGWVLRFCFAVLVGDCRGDGLLTVQILQGDLELVIRWVAAECHEVEFVDFFFVGATAVFGPLRGCAGVGGQFFLEVLRIEQMKALRKAGVLGSFAFA